MDIVSTRDAVRRRKFQQRPPFPVLPRSLLLHPCSTHRIAACIDVDVNIFMSTGLSSTRALLSLFPVSLGRALFPCAVSFRKEKKRERKRG